LSGFLNMIHLQLLLFLLILVGIYARKRGFFTDETRKNLTDFFINIILPANIVASFHVRLTNELAENAGQILLIAFGVQFFQWGLSKILYLRVAHGRQMVVRYATICSNSGFMGNPVIQGVYGTEGLMYASIFLIPVRIFMWSAGLSLFTVTSRRETVKKLLLHPCIIAVYIGIVLMLIDYRIPTFLNDTIVSLSNCTTALAMIIIGSILADVDLRTVVDRLMLYYSAIRLLLIPLMVLLVLRLLHISPLLTGIAVLLAGMPAGSTTAILAMQYDCDATYASKCVLFTTLLSLATLPLLSWLVQITR
jgi:malate permease and related proteins